MVGLIFKKARRKERPVDERSLVFHATKAWRNEHIPNGIPMVSILVSL